MASSTRARLPRFLPPDPRVEEPYLLTPRVALRVAILGVLVLAVFAVLFLRLWSLQILSSSHYVTEALNNQLRVFREPAPRGPILDRNGRVLVHSVASQAAAVSLADLPKGDGRDTELRKLAMVLHIPRSEIEAKLRQHRYDQLTPVTLAVALHRDQTDYLDEHQAEFPGVEIVPTYLRYYNSEGLAAQLFGYVGEISRGELKNVRRCTALQVQNPPPPSHQCYVAGDRVGQSGVEAAYDAYLFGTPGVEQLRVDSHGVPKGRPLQKKIPASGDALRLTIDIGTQRAAEQALTYGINLARSQGHYYADGGAVVALDPSTGEVLAMASAPTYRPSIWSGRLDPKKLAPLLNPKAAQAANFPGLNRTIDVGYPPGSTFKPVTALAALEEHLIEPFQTLQCTGSYSVPNQFGGGSFTFHNWDPFVDQPMTMPVAVAASCDTYFYQLGYQFYLLPANRGHPLQNWASRFGFGGSTAIDIGPETSGLLPTPEWREQAYTKKTDPGHWQVDRLWKPGDSILLAIGQKDLLVTPMQMARFYALVANGGKLVTPHVVADVEQPSPNGQPPTVLKRFAPAPPIQSGVDPSALSVVRDGLYQATHASNGTSTAVFGSFPVPVCGKTGTAEKVESVPGYPSGKTENQSWWVGYAPCDAPKIVVAALIENGGHGGTAAAPTALKVFEQYFGVKAQQQGVIHSD